MRTLDDIRAELVRRRQTAKRLAADLGMTYSKVIAILNGFRAVPVGFELRCQKVFEAWDESKKVGA